MNHLALLLLVVITFALGDIVGEDFSPINGITVQALSRKCAELEARVGELEMRCKKLQVSVDSASTRLELWFGLQPDAGTRLISPNGFVEPVGL